MMMTTESHHCDFMTWKADNDSGAKYIPQSVSASDDVLPHLARIMGFANAMAGVFEDKIFHTSYVLTASLDQFFAEQTGRILLYSVYKSTTVPTQWAIRFATV